MNKLTPVDVRKTSVMTNVEKEREAMIALLLTVFTPEEAAAWLDAPNDFLGGGTPLAAFKRGGVAAVSPAVAAHRDGSFPVDVSV